MKRPELKDSKITIVMPLLNEVAVIEQLVNQTATVLNQTGCQWQFILVNDGSTDGSREVLDRMADAENRIGQVTGLAWTQVGGELLIGPRHCCQT